MRHKKLYLSRGGQNKSTAPQADSLNTTEKNELETLPIIASVTDAQGQKVNLNASEFGQYVAQKYQTVFSQWADDFVKYYRSENMGERYQALVKNLDAVSKEYIDLHEVLTYVSIAQNSVLVNKDFLWTDIDRFLLKRNQDMVNANQPPFLKQVNLEWSSSYTNFYGLYDMPLKLLQALDGKAIVEGGGYIGDTMCLFRDLFPNSPLYSFEPVSKNIEQMNNLLADDIAKGRLHTFKLGLASQPGSLKLSKIQGESDSMASAKFDYGQESLYEEVAVITLDSFVRENKLEVGLVKLDVEGIEFDIVKGMLETIKEQRPVLVIACYHEPHEFYELKPFLEQLNLNYAFKIRRSCFCNPLCELVLIAYPKELAED